MEAYLFIFVIMLYLLLISTIMHNYKINIDFVFTPIVSLLLLFFMSCRNFSVGADTKQYYYAFLQIREISLSDLFSTPVYQVRGYYEQKFEVGYMLLNKFIGYFLESGQGIIVVSSFIIIFLLQKWIYRYSENSMLSMWLYVTLGIFQTEMNIARNAIAIFICYLAFRYIAEKNLIKYIGCILIASSFHMTAIIFLPIYFLQKINLTSKRLCIVFLLIFAICLSFPLLQNYIGLLVPMRYMTYLSSNTTKYEALMLGILNLGLVLLVLCFSDIRRWKLIIQQQKIGFWMLVLNISFFGIAYALPTATRIAALFGPYLIVFLPNLIETCIKEKKYKVMANITIALICGVQYILRLFINNIGGTMPYVFYWD